MAKFTVTITTGSEYFRVSLYAVNAAYAALDGAQLLAPHMPRAFCTKTTVRQVA